MSRFIPGTDEQRDDMLGQIGIKEVDELFTCIPEKIRLQGRLNLPPAMSEMELAAHMRELSKKNCSLDDYVCFLGAGAYDHYIPSAVNHIISRQEFYTSYTPYQPEISQGTLQTIFEYQTMICELTGMDAANASIYDGATALAEAASMACRSSGREEVVVSKTVHPEYRKVLNTYARFNGIKVIELDYEQGVTELDALEKIITGDTAAIIVQSPNFFGIIEKLDSISEIVHKGGALLIAAVDPISLGILKSPGELGADIVVGEGQSLGNSLSFGGPYLGFFASTKKLVRKMPGRIAGQTVDNMGRTGYVLTMQTREQHIRREKATSNICSNQALNALAATVYLTVMGRKGLRKAAELCMQKAHYACKKLTETGKFNLKFDAPFFKEFAVESSENIDNLNSKLLESRIIGGYALEKAYPELVNCWLLAFTEKRTREEIDTLAGKAGEML